MKDYFLSILSLFIFSCGYSQGEDSKLSLDEMNKKRQNPVEGLRSIYGQAILVPDTGDGTAQSYSIQPVWPFKISDKIKLVTYTIIPIQHIPRFDPNGESATGLGNILFNGYFTPLEKKGKLIWGGGPAIQFPTRTDAALGSNRVSMGPSGLLYFAGDKFSGGIVAQNYWSLGGTGVNKVDEFSLQYIAYYNFNQGWFALSNATIVANWLATTDQKWLVPVGGGTGKTFQIGKGKLFYCGTAQLFYNAVKPDYLGNWEVIFQLQVIL